MSNLGSILTQIATDWEALTPPSETAAKYHLLDEQRDFQGESGHRGFFFDLPRRARTVLQNGSTETIEWEVNAHVLLSAAGSSMADLADYVADESQLLAKTVENRSSWPANTDVVLVDNVDAEQVDDGNIMLNLELRITVGESI